MIKKEKICRVLILVGIIFLLLPSVLSAKGQQGGGQDALTILWVQNNLIDGHERIFEKFTKDTGIRIEYENRVGGAEGETIIKTRLASGDMADIFIFNTGSKVNDINPTRNCVDLTADFGSKVSPQFKVAATATDGKMYSVPIDYGAQAGAVLYNKTIYQKLGLKIPATWKEYLANCDKIQAAGITAVIGTYKTTWTSQMIFLSEEYNIKAALPNWPSLYTANKANYGNTPAALRSFEKLRDVAKYLNKDYLATTLEQGLDMLANGEGAHFSMQSHRIAYINTNYPEKINDIGLFAQPGDDPGKVGLTVWMPSGFYVNNKSPRIDAAKKFLSFLLTQEAYDIYTSVIRPGGPPVVSGLSLPANAMPAVKDAQSYFESGKYEPALEFESPIKGPSLEQLCIEVTTGNMTPAAAAATYDEDVKKQAVLLNLPGWN